MNRLNIFQNILLPVLFTLIILFIIEGVDFLVTTRIKDYVTTQSSPCLLEVANEPIYQTVLIRIFHSISCSSPTQQATAQRITHIIYFLIAFLIAKMFRSLITLLKTVRSSKK